MLPRSRLFQLTMLSVLLLSGCTGSGNYAPVSEGGAKPGGATKYHVVSRGDSLFSIAWRYSLDYRKLASANNIGSPFTIYPGQKLLLAESPLPNKPVAQVEKKSTVSTSRTLPSSVKKSTPGAYAKNGTNTKAGANKNPPIQAWRWPTRGTLSERFRDRAPVHKGIDITGKLGQPVYAANSGKVVYAGSGLVGYGLLIIIKHDEQYLSAYAHNSSIMVKEGQRVDVGERIAAMGDSGTNRVKLHFEIRKSGNPVNPITLLPKRN